MYIYIQITNLTVLGYKIELRNIFTICNCHCQQRRLKGHPNLVITGRSTATAKDWMADKVATAELLAVGELQCGAPVRQLSWFISPITMVYGRYINTYYGLQTNQYCGKTMPFLAPRTGNGKVATHKTIDDFGVALYEAFQRPGGVPKSCSHGCP